MVNKVQLYHRSSDQAMFTGIDDGKRTTTINLKLKENKRHGYFGKIEGGVANTYYNNQAFFNRFNGKEKISIYGTYSNTGTTGLGFSEQSKLGTTADNISIVDGLITVHDDGGSLDNYNGQYNGAGIPSVLTGGAHYDNKWNDDKESLNANYKVGRIDTKGENRTIQQQNIGIDSSQFNNSTEKFDNYTSRQKIDAFFKLQLDSLASITFAANGTISNNNSDDSFEGQIKNSSDILINSSERTVRDNGKNKNFNSDLRYLQKFRKKRRSFILDLSQGYNNKDIMTYLYSEINFYNQDDENKANQIVDQLKKSKFYNQIYGGL
ncbi:hypothetical protein FSB73_12530 [Arachidicoccus ginsenosidivorans]|uniref:Uncharacterized protein n=1 Tax=Arachidicoccus ginsenosidivorans TaxID=496057 RepID=A0A5B8VLH1_9BACT|nr:hypothetical protein [Arachidicoccus ginsenosidivorans]QEC72377.1 hypothetical protein FSB73_12530 [Arachidicoccus ginsenosidivorans]